MYVIKCLYDIKNYTSNFKTIAPFASCPAVLQGLHWVMTISMVMT